jgi:hypothetical protein
MAKIRKRGRAYQIDYFDPSGNRVRKSLKEGVKGVWQI